MGFFLNPIFKENSKGPGKNLEWRGGFRVICDMEPGIDLSLKGSIAREIESIWQVVRAKEDPIWEGFTRSLIS